MDDLKAFWVAEAEKKTKKYVSILTINSDLPVVSSNDVPIQPEKVFDSQASTSNAKDTIVIKPEKSLTKSKKKFHTDAFTEAAMDAKKVPKPTVKIEVPIMDSLAVSWTYHIVSSYSKRFEKLDAEYQDQAFDKIMDIFEFYRNKKNQEILAEKTPKD